MKRIFYLLLLIVFTPAFAQEEGDRFLKQQKMYRYRIYFTDKENTPYSITHPEAFLSKKSLSRRQKFGLRVDEYDLPVTPCYLEYLNQNHYRVLHVSKWNNTAIIEIPDTTLISNLSNAPFIKQTLKVWESPDSILIHPTSNRLDQIENRRDTLENFYGQAAQQIQMLNLQKLHETGYKGKDITIAVIDGGFYNADQIAGLRHCKIEGTRNFVQPHKSVFEESQEHGTMVLSCIASLLPYSLVGTAPEAKFHLLVSEDNDSEQLIEEDYWCSALEYADSVGADIVTSSLGYYKFDDPATNHQYHELDGATAINSNSASLAASRGLVVVNSAGNDGDASWKKIGFPADAANILTVGAVDKNKMNTVFSSVGNTADGRIKPDVMAMGKDSWLLDCHGNVTTANGTSFSTPILSGGIACLMQAHPKRTPLEVMDAVRKSGNNISHPNNIFGYGIPNFERAHVILKEK